MTASRYKIALVCDWFLPRFGGLELHLRDLARELNAQGHQVHLVCSTPGPEVVDGIQVHRLDVPLLPFHKTIRSRRALVPLAAVLRRERFDIIHGHTAYSPLALGAMYLAKELGIPSVFTEHSLYPGAGNRVFRMLDRLSSWTRWPTVLSAVSSLVAEDVRRISGLSEVQVLLNGSNLAIWNVPRPEQQELRVTTAMRLVKRKNAVDIVRMIPRILAGLPSGVRPRFTLVGDGPERPRIEREARALGVSEHLELLGIRPREEIPGILARSTIFVLPSIYEGLCIAAIEARSAGLPVVARLPSGVQEVVDHGVNGFLAHDADEVAEYTLRLLKDPELCRQMSEQSRVGLERFSWKRAIARHLEIYDLATQRCGRGGELRREPAEVPLGDGLSKAS